jgi:Protein of unknown function (DUF2783)
MSDLIAQSPNFRDPDGFYAALIDAHRGLSDRDSELLNARLVLILANHIGEPGVLAEALTLARGRLATEEAVGGIHRQAETPADS